MTLNHYVTGYDADTPSIEVDLKDTSVTEASAYLSNSAHNSGGLLCPP